MQRFDQRQGFLVSAILHLTLLMVLISHPPSARRPDEIDLSTLERKDIVFLPPPSVLRQIVPTPPPGARPRPIPAPAPTPPPAQRPSAPKDRFSVGPKFPLRNEGPLNLDRIGKVPKGTQADRAESSPVEPRRLPTPEPAPRASQFQGADTERSGREGLMLPPGLLGKAPSPGEGGQRAQSRTIGSGIEEAVRQMARRAENEGGAVGVPTGTGHDISGLYYDPQGADFTLWISHLGDEFRRNFVAPQAAYLGFRGKVAVEFVVERSGSISALRTVQSAGTVSLDRAVANAVSGSRYMALPSDYRPPRITFTLIVTFG